MTDPRIPDEETAAPGMPRERMNIVIVGHVDHGKSTVIGRLLADTGSLPQGKLENIKAYCERNSRPFEYAFLLDALKDEQSQGITIDTARTFFKSRKRHYIVLDAPGHIEFLKNMVTGAARAEAALLVIDAKEGIRENSRRHGYLLGMLGIRQISVLVNKMDLVDYARDVYESIREQYTRFLARMDVEPGFFIPISAFQGENLVGPSDKMPWYRGPSVLQAVDAFEKEPPKPDQPFRMPVQDIYKFTAMGDDRRIVAGRVESGSIRAGDEVVFLPSNKKARVRTIERFNAPARPEAAYGCSTGVTLDEQLYIHRGEVMVKAGEPPPAVSRLIRANIFWMGRSPMERGRSYFLKLGTAKTPVRLKRINFLIDASDSLERRNKDRVERHDVAECELELSRAVAFDPISSLEATGRFVIVDRYEISGGGIIREALADEQEELRHEVAQREEKFERSSIVPQTRAERLNQRPALILVTGEEGTDRKGIAKALEERLFEMGRFAYYVGMANVLYSVDADLLKDGHGSREEHLRRLGQIAYLMLEAGLILVVSARDLGDHDIKALETVVAPHPLLTVCLGGCRLGGDGESVLYCPPGSTAPQVVPQIITRLQESRFIFGIPS